MLSIVNDVFLLIIGLLYDKNNEAVFILVRGHMTRKMEL